MQNFNTLINKFYVQNIIFFVLFLSVISLIAWFSHRYTFQADWTAENSHTLSEASVQLLQQIEEPINISVFVGNKELKKQITSFLERYIRVKPDISIAFVDPYINPDKVRNFKVTAEGELVMAYQGRQENVKSLTEQSVSNALQRLVQQQNNTIAFLSGHGERAPDKQRNYDYQRFVEYLKTKGINASALNLITLGDIADNVQLLVIADPKTSILPGEVVKIQQYLAKGGNLLWLLEANSSLHGLEEIAKSMGIKILPGVIVDATTQYFNIADPAIALITQYPFHPIVQDLETLTLFPQAAALEWTAPNDTWEATALLQTLQQSWTETGEIKGSIEFNENTEEVAGPLTLGYAITHMLENEEQEQQQRIIVIGDSDFIANRYLDNGSNLDLAYKLVQWLLSNDRFLQIPAKIAKDTQLHLSFLAYPIGRYGLLFGIPLILLGIGISIWMQRRRR